ncbi:MAG: GxxExxY protein [Planctomycetota bacterium]
MHENQISAAIVDRSVHIHKVLGPGLLESVYQRILAYELRVTKNKNECPNGGSNTRLLERTSN